LRVWLSLFPDLADALLLPIFIGDRLEGDGIALPARTDLQLRAARRRKKFDFRKNSASKRPIAADRSRRGSL
jgi:hypothetical protein